MSTSRGEWTPLQEQVEKALTGVSKYWGRPSRTHYAIRAVDEIIASDEPPPSGWRADKGEAWRQQGARSTSH